MKLKDAPIGLFKYGNTLALKTEYWRQVANGGYVSDCYIPECFIVTSGEYFCGGVDTAEEYNNLEVEPIWRCEYCANFLNNHICLHWSKYGTIEVEPNDFCSHFEYLKHS